MKLRNLVLSSACMLVVTAFVGCGGNTGDADVPKEANKELQDMGKEMQEGMSKAFMKMKDQRPPN